jgi:hypothetical protein
LLTQNVKTNDGWLGPLASPTDTDPTEEITVRKAPLLFTALAALTLVAPACSDDDGDEDAVDTESTQPDDGTDSPDTTGGDDTADTTEVAGGTGDCGEPGFEGEISRTADGDHVEASITGDDVVDAVAFDLMGNYTIYVADHEIDRSVLDEYLEGSFSTDNAVVADEGGVVASMFIYGVTVEPGTEITFEAGVPSPIVDSGGGASANTLGAQGTLTVIDVTDSSVCAEIDYSDDHQTITGTVTAEIYQG